MHQANRQAASAACSSYEDLAYVQNRGEHYALSTLILDTCFVAEYLL